jgi:hypothetical protein
MCTWLSRKSKRRLPNPLYGTRSAANKILMWLYISHSAAAAAVVNFKEAHIFEKLLCNFSKICASKEFYSLPTEVGTAA